MNRHSGRVWSNDQSIINYVSVIVLQHAHPVSGDQTASTPATVTMEHTAVLMMASANALQDGPACTAHSVSNTHTSEKD